MQIFKKGGNKISDISLVYDRDYAVVVETASVESVLVVVVVIMLVVLANSEKEVEVEEGEQV